MKSGIEGTAKVVFGGKIQISFALNKKTHNPCILFNELPHEKKVANLSAMKNSRPFVRIRKWFSNSMTRIQSMLCELRFI